MQSGEKDVQMTAQIVEKQDIPRCKKRPPDDFETPDPVSTDRMIRAQKRESITD